jgi:hypothetical protein
MSQNPNNNQTWNNQQYPGYPQQQYGYNYGQPGFPQPQPDQPNSYANKQTEQPVSGLNTFNQPDGAWGQPNNSKNPYSEQGTFAQQNQPPYGFPGMNPQGYGQPNPLNYQFQGSYGQGFSQQPPQPYVNQVYPQQNGHQDFSYFNYAQNPYGQNAYGNFYPPPNGYFNQFGPINQQYNPSDFSDKSFFGQNDFNKGGNLFGILNLSMAPTQNSNDPNYDIYSRDTGVGGIAQMLNFLMKDINSNPSSNMNQGVDQNNGPLKPSVPDNKIDMGLIGQALNNMNKKFDETDIPILNDKNQLNTDEYWKQPAKNINTQDLDAINKAQQNKLNVNANLNTQTGKNQIEVSNFFGIAKLKDKNELDSENIIDKNSITKTLQLDKQFIKAINNCVISSFVPMSKSNCLDDLDQLLTQSPKFQEAKKFAGNSKYRDESFPAAIDSIWGFGDTKSYRKNDLEKYIWCRPEEYFVSSGYKGVPRLFDTIDCEDIMQGSLGDCYFLAAIASIAKYSKRLERIFLVKQHSPHGIYVIALCINGIWEDVVLDDRVPCRPVSKEPAFNHSKTGELWVILLEKAWAKIHGGYMNIAAGLTREALRDLTGASAKTIFVEQNKANDQVWEEIYDANNKNFILCAGSDDLNSGSDAYIEKIGIAGSHAYSLLDVIEVTKTNSGYRLVKPSERSSIPKTSIERLVKLRNPWGKGEWKGDWCDTSPKWSSQLKQDLKVVKAEDGIFYMSFTDFCKYYSDIQICYYHDNYKYSAIKVQNPNNQTCYLGFTLTTEGQFYFSVNQKNCRFFKKDMGYKYSPLVMMIGCYRNGKIEYIGSAMKEDKENWIVKQCKPGKYFVTVLTPWVSCVDEFSFSIYGPEKSVIEQISKSSLPKNYLEGLFESHALQDSKTPLNKLSEPGTGYKYFDTKNGFGYLYFKNDSPGTTMEITVEMVNSKNIKLCEPCIGLRPTVTIAPNSTKILAYEATGLPYWTEMRLISSFKRSASDNIKLAKEKGTKMRKFLKGNTVDINQYILYHLSGMILYYENNTSNYSLSEKIRFTMNNCHIEGLIGDHVELVVPPMGNKTISIIPNDSKKSFECKIKNMDYEVIEQ